MNKKILVVDDQESTRKIILTNFDEKYIVLEAIDGLDAIKILSVRKDINLILLDLTMPNMSGEAFLFSKSMIEGVEDIPVIIISAEEDQEIIDEYYDAGVNGYFTKPLDIEKLSNLVEKIISNDIKYGKTSRGYDSL